MPTSRKYELDMCNGPLFSKIVLYSIPLILTGILQLLYNTVNIVVVGRFVGSNALAAVGSTSALINLIINLFFGLSIGASVVMAKHYGAGQQNDANETVHTAIAISTVGGIILTVFGVIVAKPILQAMGTPDDVLEHACTLYENLLSWHACIYNLQFQQRHFTCSRRHTSSSLLFIYFRRS